MNADELFEDQEEDIIENLCSLLYFHGGGDGEEGENNGSGYNYNEDGDNIEGRDDLKAAEGDADNPEEDNLEDSLPEYFLYLRNLYYNQPRRGDVVKYFDFNYRS